MTRGTTFIYEGDDERIEGTVTHETREVLGLLNIVVNDTVTRDGEVELVDIITESTVERNLTAQHAVKSVHLNMTG